MTIFMNIYLIMNNMVDVWYIQTPSGNICSYQQAIFFGNKCVQVLQPGPLVHLIQKLTFISLQHNNKVMMAAFFCSEAH